MNKVREARKKRQRKLLKIVGTVAITIFIVSMVGSCISGQTLFRPYTRSPEILEDFPDDFITGHGG